MAVAAVAAMAAGSGLSAIGSIYQGQANENVAKFNAQVANQNAESVIGQGKELARRALVNSRKMLGAERAGFAAAGVTQTGSAQWVMRNSAAQGELDALTIQNNAATKAIAFKNEAMLDTQRGRTAKTAGQLGAASELLHGVSSIAKMGMES